MNRVKIEKNKALILLGFFRSRVLILSPFLYIINLTTPPAFFTFLWKARLDVSLIFASLQSEKPREMGLAPFTPNRP